MRYYFFLLAFFVASICFAQKTVDINKTIDGITFVKIETGWSESTNTPGNMFPEFRLMVKNSSGATIKDLGYEQSNISYSFLENDVIVYEDYSAIHNREFSPWIPNTAKYICPHKVSFVNFKEKFQTKTLSVEIYYHGKKVCKVNIVPELVSWDYCY